MPDTSPSVVDAPHADDVPAVGDARRLGANEAVRWVAYVACVWVALRPVLLTTVWADDFVNPFVQFPQTRLDVVEMARYGWRGAQGAGHINFVGQVIGSLVTTSWMVAMADLGIRYSTIYAATKLVVYLLVAVAAGAFTQRVARGLGRPLSAWRARIYVSVALFATLQIHIPWSNDPVTSYPLSGFAAAAIGFGVLSLAFDALERGSFRRSCVCGGAGALSLLYYEIGLAAIAAIAGLVAWRWLAIRGAEPRPARAVLAQAAPMFVLPAAVGLATKVAMGPAPQTYSGTEVAVGGTQVRSGLVGLLGTLPGSSWHLALEFLEGPVDLLRTPVLVLVALGAVLGVLWRRHPPPQRAAPAVAVAERAALVSVPVIYLLGATAIQTGTQKVQDEAPRIGYVYNYYAIGATCVAVLLALLVAAVRPRSSPVALRAGVVAVAVGFAATQLLLNWNVAVQFNARTGPSRDLLVAFSERRPQPERCGALSAWSGGAWPDVYEEGMIDGLQAAYEHFHGTPFCDGFVRPP